MDNDKKETSIMEDLKDLIDLCDKFVKTYKPTSTEDLKNEIFDHVQTHFELERE